MQIICNRKARDLLYWHDLTEVEQSRFDWLDPNTDGHDGFFRYRGNVYHLSEFMPAGKQFSGWHAYSSDTYFSGVLVKSSLDGESVTVGRYYA